MNFVPAVTYFFYLALPAAFTQPGDHLLAKPSISLQVEEGEEAGEAGDWEWEYYDEDGEEDDYEEYEDEEEEEDAPKQHKQASDEDAR